jgi:hypothetical protein
VNKFKHQNLSCHFVGVTGHRDLVEADRPGLDAAVNACMNEIEALHRNKKHCLLSGLAAGADQLVAQCALNRGWALHAVFAASSDSYHAALEDIEAHILDISIRSFASTMSEKDANKLLNDFLPRCDEVTIVTPNSIDGEAGYAAVANALVGGVESLIALWDGTPSRGVGGTAYTLSKYIETPPNKFDQLDSERAAYWVRTRRLGEELNYSEPAWEKIRLSNLSIKPSH